MVLAGPDLPATRGFEVLRELAPILLDRPLAWLEVERRRLPDLNGGSACWSTILRDGHIELRGSVDNGDGNPRDGWGYSMSFKLFVIEDGREAWRAEIFGGGYEPILTGAFRLCVRGVSPAAFDAARARALALLPDHRDVTFDDSHALRGLIADFDRHGHVAWVRDFLKQPLRPGVPWVSAALCARKLELLGPDAETARAWATIEPHASRAWSALAEAGGDARTHEGDARFLAALTNPFSPRTIEAASRSHPVEAVAGAVTHVWADPAWRWLVADERDAFEAYARSWAPSSSATVTWQRAGHVASSDVDREIAAVFQPDAAIELASSYVLMGPPLAERGAMSHRCGIGTGHTVRRAIVEPSEIAARSGVIAVSQTNAEDRLACFGLVWLDAERQLVWRAVVHEEGERLERSPIELRVIDRGVSGWGAEITEHLRRIGETPNPTPRRKTV
jgi:hypothetical protein